MKTVPLHGKRAAGRVALVDDGDYDLVMQYRWNILEPNPKPGRRGFTYASTNDWSTGRHAVLLMHTLIMGIKGVDHRDRDGLNNQRSNLRPATHAQNMFNKGSHGGSSRFKGVSWYRAYGKWMAYISAYKKRHFLGYFSDEEAAARAYDAAARRLHGEFAYQNFPSTEAEQAG